MRNLLIVSAIALFAAAATGCASPCGEGWRPGSLLFGRGHQTTPAYGQCCDPCGGGGMMSAPMAAPCCQ